jgi:cell division protein ZapE
VIAKELAKKTMLLCFDELFVSDIADAMILGRLFKALFAQGICLVTTSNAIPDDLYKNGLQRKLFLPAIELLKSNTHVLSLTSTTDYRARQLKKAGVFFSPHNEIAHENMEKLFALLTQGEHIHHEPIEIHGRTIRIRKRAHNVIWFDFKALCTTPRSQHDYLAIAENYSTIFISHIPVIPADAKDMITLFIHLIDVLYDARVRLIFSAADTVDKLHQHGYKLFEYQRACSRLLEMQSEQYFTK